VEVRQAEEGEKKNGNAEIKEPAIESCRNNCEAGLVEWRRGGEVELLATF